MPAAASASLLFHPKKKNGVVVQPAEPAKRKRPYPARPRAKPAAEDDDLPPPPAGPYQEFRVMSSSLNGWKYDVMKFESHKRVDVSQWQQPLKLNRKDPRREEDQPAVSAPVAVGPMLGLDGKPVLGMDGRMVMVDAEGRAIHGNSGRQMGGARGGEKGKGPASKKFQKKTKQVFLVSEDVRQLRKEERYPWVIEDATGAETWIGSMEEVAKSQNHCMLIPGDNNVFKFVPIHRWYKFQKKSKRPPMSLAEVDAMIAKQEKSKEPQLWLMRNRNGQAPSAATAAMFKAEAEGREVAGEGSLVYGASSSRGPGGRKLRTVDSGGDLFGDDDEDGEDRKRKAKELGRDGDLDEMDFEEDFADDEEKMEPDDKEDEDAKELEERLQKEYKAANKGREGNVDDSDEDEPEALSKAGEALKKTLKNLEKNNAYDSDDEKNPYASSEEEEEEEPPVVPDGPAIQPQDTQKPRPADAKPVAGNGQAPAAGASNSRAGSPNPPSGHSLVAKRATDPKMQRAKSGGVSGAGSRATSPLASASLSRATSPSATGSRAGSPAAQSPTPGGSGVPRPGSNKRKADEAAGALPSVAPGAAPKAKKRRPAVPAGQLEDRMLIEWLRDTPNASTRDCILHFTPYLTDEAKKAQFTALVKEVAQLKGGVLVLRSAYRGGEAAPSPAAASPSGGS